MSSIITLPNLPKSKVKTLICTDKDKAVMDFFKSVGISVILNQANSISTLLFPFTLIWRLFI